MTPGFAKPRSELPWLPYESLDRVIINSHNFNNAGPLLLGDEVVFWSPTHDAAGNGTSTLSALMGSITGALTSMDAATDWVSDTDLSGVRRIDMDGSNDHILSSVEVNARQSTQAIWIYLTGYPASAMQVCGFVNGLNSLVVDKTIVVRTDGKIYGYCFDTAIRATSVSASAIPLNTWTHLALTLDGTNAKVWINGIEVGTVACTTPDFSSAYNTRNLMVSGQSGVLQAGSFGAFRWDNYRLASRAYSGSELLQLAAGRNK